MRNLPIDNIPDDEIQPWHHLGGLEHICELRKSCTVLYGIFTELARLVYSDTDGRLVGTPDVVWNRKNPSIWIDTELKFEDQHPEFRPAIYVQLSPMKIAEIIPGHNGRVTGANRFAERHYEQSVSGAVTFMHVAHTIGEACALADNTSYFLSLMQDPICEDFCFTKFFASERTPLEKIQDESTERYVSGTTFSFEFMEAWDVTQESPILKSIDLVNSSRHATVDHANIITETKIPGQSK